MCRYIDIYIFVNNNISICTGVQKLPSETISANEYAVQMSQELPEIVREMLASTNYASLVKKNARNIHSSFVYSRRKSNQNREERDNTIAARIKNFAGLSAIAKNGGQSE